MMNILSVIFILILASCFSANAQVNPVDDRKKKIAQEFDALPSPQRLKYISYKRQAYTAIANNKFFTCLVAINDAQAIFKKDVDLQFLSGLCLAEIHDVDKAIEQYKMILAIDPEHWQALENIIEINYFAGRYEEAIKYIAQVNQIIEKEGRGERLPLLDFKHLIALKKLSKQNPAKYAKQIGKLRNKFTYMDDTPFYYYAKAIEAFEAGEKELGLNWIIKAYLIFSKNEIIGVWNKALVDTGYIDAHEIIMSNKKPKE